MPLMKITKDSQDLVVIEHKPGLFEYVLSIASIFLIYTFFEILLLTPEDKKNLLGAAFGCKEWKNGSYNERVRI